MPPKKVLAGILVLAVLLVGVVAGVFLVRQQQELRKEAAPATTISLSPAQTTAKIGDAVTLSVLVDTAENKATAADVRITYDPKKLALSEFKPGTFLPVVLTSPKVDNGQGVATAVFGAQIGTVPKGKGTLATLVFQAKEAGSASVTFSPQTEMTGIDEETNVLIAKNSATVTIQAAAGSAVSPPGTSSPAQAQAGGSPTATQAPKSATQASGGASSSSTGSPSPTASPKATTTPKATAKATSSPGPTGTPKELPQAGFELPVLGMFGAGVLILLLGVILAF